MVQVIPTRRRPWSTLVVVAMIALMHGALAHAQPKDRKDQDAPPEDQDAQSPQDADRLAREFYLEGEADYAAGRYELAAAKFARAYELSGRSALLFNIANAYERMGDYQKAVDYLRRYLESPKVDDVVSVRERIKRMEATIEANRVRDAERDAIIAREPPEPSEPPEPPEPSGASSAEHADPRPEPIDRAAAAVSDSGPGSGPGSILGVAPGSMPGSRDTRGPRRWPAYALFGASGVALTSAVLFGIASRGAADDASVYCASGGGAPLCLSGAQDSLHREKRYALFADVSGALAVLTAGAGVYLFVRANERAANRAVQSAHQAGARPVTSMAPVLLPGGFGVGVFGVY